MRELRVRHGGFVRRRFEIDAEEAEPAAHQPSHKSGPLADSRREHERIQAVQRGGRRRDCACDVVREDLQSESGLRIVRVFEHRDVAGARQPEQAGLVLQCVVELLERGVPVSQ